MKTDCSNSGVRDQGTQSRLAKIRVKDYKEHQSNPKNLLFKSQTLISSIMTREKTNAYKNVGKPSLPQALPRASDAISGLDPDATPGSGCRKANADKPT